jgi:hypothetical protein
MSVSDDYSIRDLGAEAQAYLEGELSRGYSLSEVLLHTVRSNIGRVFAYLPAAVDTKHLVDFQNGFLMNANITLDLFADMVQHELQARRDRLFIIESPCSRSDAWLLRRKSRVKFFGEHVYHICTSIDAPDAIGMAIREAYSPAWLVSAIVTLGQPLPLLWLDDEELSRDELTTLGNNASHVIVSAWDDEGFIYWAKR